MGNSQSSPGNSIRSRASRKANGSAEDKRTARMSKAVSVYQTPPGSLDIDDGSNKTRSKSSRSHTPNEVEEPAASEEPERTMPGAEPLEQKPEPPRQRKWRAGVYSLANARGGTSMDLSAADNKSVIGFPSHEGKNQQWKFEQLGNGYTIQSVATNLFLTVDEGPADGAFVVASPFPVSWKVETVSEGEQVVVRLMWPNGKFAFDLAGFGNATPGTKIQLAPSRVEERCQQWILTEHESNVIEEKASTPQELENTTSSAPLETVLIAEDKDAITTTRTTTTSTITTVTTITRTPRTIA